MYEIKFSKHAEAFLSKLKSRELKQRLLIKIKLLSINPYIEQSKKLSNHLKRRIRVGKYRVIYAVDDDLIKIYKIGKRGEIYKNL
ncbi:MAG: type II toxin-antitoxin system RelE/ParE family toxin [Gammaproteobacteria bacterium]|nr:MAG: type II toxin-antitoxin system RelE/ParE family toxin [Gammaproteobacteria bacterium]